MPDERSRPQGSKPDTASIIQKLFRDEPQEPQPVSPEAEAPVGVLVPPEQGVPPVAEPGIPAAQDAPITGEGTVETPPAAPTGEVAVGAAGARWYVIHTYSGYENKVRTNL